MSKEYKNPEDFELDENGIPKHFILWLTKMYGAHLAIAPSLMKQGKLVWPSEFAIRWWELEKKRGSKPKGEGNGTT